jgi:hypothetical protein
MAGEAAASAEMAGIRSMLPIFVLVGELLRDL